VTFLDHAGLTLDNSRVENAIRPFVVGRKNWLFHGNENRRGGLLPGLHSDRDRQAQWPGTPCLPDGGPSRASPRRNIWRVGVAPSLGYDAREELTVRGLHHHPPHRNREEFPRPGPRFPGPPDRHTTHYFNVRKLFPTLRRLHIEGRYKRFIDRLAKTPVLILDDFGLEVLEPEDRLAVLEIIEDPAGKMATIIASQFPVSLWQKRIGAPRCRCRLRPAYLPG
jgi:hypothetical protein